MGGEEAGGFKCCLTLKKIESVCMKEVLNFRFVVTKVH